jgi:hypothetical protein
MRHVLYSTDGKGHWFKREWVEQCPHKIFLGGKCQGVKGHKGIHWCYREDGSFQWENQDKEVIKKTDIAGGDTPPGHKNWVSPKKMMKEHYLHHYTDTVITDKDLITRLEKNKPPEKGASIDRPVDPKEWKKIKKKLKKSNN